MNKKGPNVGLYIPSLIMSAILNYWSATNRIITAKDHAFVHLNIGHIDENDIYTDQFCTFSLSDFLKDQCFSWLGLKFQKKNVDLYVVNLSFTRSLMY
ncbi:hypothetical protein MKX03_020694 [Papaver bracteatum]|nr:hypothetical protein MKX03_020694 [Papaver bracteatum]